jgi:hypothetical protein
MVCLATGSVSRRKDGRYIRTCRRQLIKPVVVDCHSPVDARNKHEIGFNRPTGHDSREIARSVRWNVKSLNRTCVTNLRHELGVSNNKERA